MRWQSDIAKWKKISTLAYPNSIQDNQQHNFPVRCIALDNSWVQVKIILVETKLPPFAPSVNELPPCMIWRFKERRIIGLCFRAKVMEVIVILCVFTVVSLISYF